MPVYLVYLYLLMMCKLVGLRDRSISDEYRSLFGFAYPACIKFDDRHMMSDCIVNTFNYFLYLTLHLIKGRSRNEF
jgi:hypothetical protein|tara:strand:+ start:106 stop:333 length:228 start_codon:yes stop_codon:yes gene_type:complete